MAAPDHPMELNRLLKNTLAVVLAGGRGTRLQHLTEIQFDEGARRGSAIDSVVAGGCVVSGATVRRCLLFRDVRVNAYARVEESVVLPGAEIGQHCRIKKAIVDANCRVPEGTIVGEDPPSDAKRFHRTESGVTVVSAAMVTGKSV